MPGNEKDGETSVRCDIIASPQKQGPRDKVSKLQTHSCPIPSGFG